jgi:hypothetical protein
MPTQSPSVPQYRETWLAQTFELLPRANSSAILETLPACAAWRWQARTVTRDQVIGRSRAADKSRRLPGLPRPLLLLWGREML